MNSQYYYLRNKKSSKVLDHYYSQSIKGATLGNVHEHHWKLDKYNGYTVIVNRKSGKVLDHYYSKEIKAADYLQNPVDEHLWIFNKKSGKVLDHYYSNDIKAADELSVPCDEHLWEFIPVGGVDPFA